MSLSDVSKNSWRARTRPEPSMARDVPSLVMRTTENPFSMPRISPTSVW
jgi:hypothetical protein